MAKQCVLITGGARSGRNAFTQRLTGDVCGAIGELSELAVLLLGPLAIHWGD